MLERHIKLRNELLKMVKEDAELMKLLQYYDFVMLKKFRQKDLKIRT